ncbi:MAG: serine hydrolase [Spirulina sp. SIO3F2]|nr:serine hydrolase [Spirulina sp. SIO3F2]
MPPEDLHHQRRRARQRRRQKGLGPPIQASAKAQQPAPRSRANKKHLRLLPTTNSASIAPGLAPSEPSITSSQQPSQRRAQHESLKLPSSRLNSPQLRAVWVLRWLVRGLIGAVGSTVILGTILNVLGGSQYVENPSDNPIVAQVSDSLEAMTQLPLGTEMVVLKEQVVAIAQENTALDPHVFVLDLDTGAYLNYRGGNPVPAASTITLPILVAFFQDVDAGKIDPKEMLVADAETIAGTQSKLGTPYSALETATRMISLNDHTATNMLIKRMGGANLLNQRFGTWGLNATAIHERLPDLTGQNQTSSVDLAHLLVQVNQGELVSLPARDQLLGMMQAVKNNTLLPKGLDSKATIAHKTGDIKSMLADVGVVDTPTGKRYTIVVMVNRPENSLTARGLIQTISRQVYQHFQQPLPTAPPASPAPEGVIADERPPKVEANAQP